MAPRGSRSIDRGRLCGRCFAALAICLVTTAPLSGQVESHLLPTPVTPVEELASTESSLESLEELTLQGHPEIQAAWHNVQAAEGRALQAGLCPNPQIGVASPQLAGSQSQYNVFMSQDVLTGGKLRLSTAAACQEVEQARLAALRTRFDVLTAVRRQFYIALTAQNRVAVLEEMVEIGRKSQTIGERLLKVGEGTKTDMLLLEIELNKAEVALENAQNVLTGDKRQLAAAVGVPELAIGVLYGDLSQELPRFEIEALRQNVVNTNAQATSAQVEVQRTRTLLDRAIVEPSPTFNIMGGYQYDLGSDVQSQGIAQVTMTVPLWDRNQGNIRAAQAQVGRAMADARRVQTTLAGQAAEALARYRSALQQVERYTNVILPKSRESLRLTQELYDRGQIDFLRLLQAQRTLSEVNLNYIDAQQARWIAAADIANLLQVEKFP